MQLAKIDNDASSPAIASPGRRDDSVCGVTLTARP
jgi:hypothetical protein